MIHTNLLNILFRVPLGTTTGRVKHFSPRKIKNQPAVRSSKHSFSSGVVEKSLTSMSLRGLTVTDGSDDLRNIYSRHTVYSGRFWIVSALVSVAMTTSSIGSYRRWFVSPRRAACSD